MSAHASRSYGYERAPHCEYPPSPSRRYLSYQHVPEEPRTTRHLAIGIPCMLFTAIVYFVGGFLFVTSYNGDYPLISMWLDKPSNFAIQFFQIIGPILFFAGLFLFIVSYSYMCRGVNTCKV